MAGKGSDAAAKCYGGGGMITHDFGFRDAQPCIYCGKRSKELRNPFGECPELSDLLTTNQPAVVIPSPCRSCGRTVSNSYGCCECSGIGISFCCPT